MKNAWLRISIYLSIVGLLGAWGCEMRTTTPTITPSSSTQQAVIGGKPDTRYPSIGSLQAQRRSFCTGTLIASRLVITAAHCIDSAVDSQNRGIKIEFRIDTPTTNSFQSTYYEVDSMINHPQYGRSSGRIVNDIGVVILKKDVTGVTPMPVNTTALSNTLVGKKVLFLGYGLIQTRPQRTAPGRKYGAEITCRRVENDRIQTQDNGTSICSGDSGGPALYTVNGTLSLIGVNSYVTGSTSGGQPNCDGDGWSFRTDFFTSWIQPLINKHGGKCKTDTDCGPCYKCDATQGKCVLKGTAQTATYCKPCSNPSQCGGNTNLCQRQAAGNRCLQACDINGCCPLGTSCQVLGGQKQCVPDSNACADVACQSDTECGPGEECNNGTCRPKPVTPSAKLCKQCTQDSDCGAGATCRDYPDGKYCTQPCVADNFCPTGYSCQLVGNTRQCIADGGECKCQADTDCYTGFTCQSDICQRAGGGKYNDSCENNRKCAQGFQCLTTNSGKVCYKPCKGTNPVGEHGNNCSSDGRCNNGARCYGVRGVGYICLQACSSDSSCTYGGACTDRGTNLCTCDKDEDCKRGNYCNKSKLSSWGVCSPQSNNTNECDQGYTCQYIGGTSNYCLPAPTQRSGEECGGVQRCQEGMFCARTSGGGNVCIRSCSNDNTCSKEGGSCQRSGNTQFCGCNNGEICAPGYVCKAISSNNKVCTPGTCTEDNDCGARGVCDAGTCKEKPECTKNEDCLVDQACQAGKCVDLTKPAEPKEEPPVTKAEPPTPQAEPVTPDQGRESETPLIAEPPASGDAGPGTQQDSLKPPSTGCSGCSLSSQPAPDSGFPLWMLLLLLPILRRRR